jgi:hypothetical protein
MTKSRCCALGQSRSRIEVGLPMTLVRNLPSRIHRPTALLLFISIIAGSYPAFAQSKASSSGPPSNHMRAICPPGHRVEFKFGSTSLYVDLKWVSAISTLSKVEAKFGGNCPSVPVEGIRLFFGGSRSSEVMKTVEERGLPYWLQLAPTTMFDREQAPKLIGSSPETRRYISNGGYVEDVTTLHSNPKNIDSSPRFYRIQPPVGSDGAIPAAIMMGCSGKPSSRVCNTTYAFNTDIRVAYRFDLNRRLVSTLEHSQRRGLVEPDDLLAIDAVVRTFIVELLTQR